MTSLAKAPEDWLTFGLAFVGGYADAAGFVLAKLFTGHITGNLVLMAVSAAAMDWRPTFDRLSAVGSFLAGIVLSVVCTRILSTRNSSALVSTALTIEVVLVVAAYLALLHHMSAGTEVFVVCLSLALGLQNGAFRRAGGLSVHTTYLTGMITGLTVSAAEKFHSRRPSRTPAPPDRLRVLCGIWAIFVLGAATGAASVYRFKEGGILGILLVLLTLIIGYSTASRSANLAE